MDRAILATVLEDASKPLREIADAAGVSAPTVSSRLERLEELGIVGPARKDVDLSRLGTLVLILAPPEDRETLAQHEDVFQVHKTQSNEAVGLALLDEGRVESLHAAFPRARTLVLTERTHASLPRLPSDEARSTCAQCGKPITGDEGIEVILGGSRYLACCPMCKKELEERYERHEEDS